MGHPLRRFLRASPRHARRDWALAYTVLVSSVLGALLAPSPALANNVPAISWRAEYFMNPDGSGKVHAEACVRATDSHGVWRRLSRAELLGAGKMFGLRPGVLQQFLGFRFEAVSVLDVQYRRDGWACAVGTGFFDDVNQAIVPDLPWAFPRFAPSLQRMGAELHVRWTWPLLEFYLSMLLEGEISRRSSKQGKPDTDREWRDEFRGLLFGVLYQWRIEEVVHLPGRVVRARNVRLLEDRTIRIVLLNWALIATVRVTTQDQVLDEMAVAGSVGAGLPYALKTLFGSEDWPEVVVAPPLAPHFDYEREVAAAKTAMPALAERLGLRLEN